MDDGGVVSCELWGRGVLKIEGKLKFSSHCWDAPDNTSAIYRATVPCIGSGSCSWDEFTVIFSSIDGNGDSLL